MKLKIKLNKKVILAISVIVVLLIAIGGVTFTMFYNINKETMAQPMNEEQPIIEDKNIIDISELEETAENTIEENVVENEPKDNKNNENTKNNPSNKKTNNTATYYIKVNYGAQVVTIYKKDDNGNYTVPVKAMVCSTGVATPTSGVYSIPARWEWLRLQGYVWGHYCTQIKGNILFHSVPYLKEKDPSSLEYWEYDKLGTYASAGCIRLTVQDAKWIYNNCGKGTKVEFYSSSNPGPLGKPSAKKISSYDDYLKNWDPTDPDPNNPWKSYKETPKNETKPENITNNENKNETNKNQTQNQETTIKNEVNNNQTTNGGTTIKNEVNKNETQNQETTSKNEVNNNQTANGGATSKNEVNKTQTQENETNTTKTTTQADNKNTVTKQ